MLKHDYESCVSIILEYDDVDGEEGDDGEEEMTVREMTGRTLFS